MCFMFDLEPIFVLKINQNLIIVLFQGSEQCILLVFAVKQAFTLETSAS